jgi:hypothetical protein
MNRRNFLRLGALFVSAALEPRRAYSFIWAPKPYRWEPVLDDRFRDDQIDAIIYAVAAAVQIPVRYLRMPAPQYLDP